MHELGIVFSIREAVEDAARGAQVERVASVTLEVGEVAGVVEYYLKDCWRWAVKDLPLMAGSELVVETVPAVTYCEACEATYPTVEHGRICPHCGSDRTYLIQGRELVVKDILAQ